MTVQKKDAVEKLERAGEHNAADELRRWKSAHNDDKGWDGWLRKAYPELAQKHFPQLGEVSR